jgi:2-methylisocitrate lyase-like PEP mutase family enzyme
MVARTVEHYIRSGVAGAHLEDQILTKRCGHLSGKKVVPREEYSKQNSPLLCFALPIAVFEIVTL